MKSIKKSILILFSLWQLGFIHAQTTDETLHRMYWNYRERFKKYFITIGGEPGQSVVNSSISMGTSGYTIYSDSFKINAQRKREKVPANSVLPQYWGKKGFGDATVDYDWYLGTLATEYWLLKHYNNDSDAMKALKNELYFAINAIERLDYMAEEYYDKSNGVLNGFFIRDDIPQDHMKELRLYDPQIQWHSSNVTRGVLHTDTLWINENGNRKLFFYGPDGYQIQNNTNPEAHNYKLNFWEDRVEAEMSIDQLIGILAGFKFVQKYVDWDLEVDPDGSLTYYQKKNIVSWIAEITDRYMEHITNSYNGIKYYDGETIDGKKRDLCKKMNEQPWAKIGGGPNRARYTSKINCEIINGSGNCELDSCYNWSTDVENEPNNPTFANNANYVIVNPAKGERHVYRGPYGFAYGYPLEVIGEQLASANQQTPKDYPGVSVTLDDEEQITRYTLDAVTGFLYVCMPNLANAIDLATHDMGCPGLTSPDLVSLCLIGKPMLPKHASWWKDIWNAFPKKDLFIKALKDKNPTNMTMKLAVITGTWDQTDFNDLAEVLGYKYHDLLYALTNDKAPLKSKSFYQDLLIKARKFGPFDGLTNAPFNDDDILASPYLSGRDHYFNDQYYGTDFMFLYNLYRIADIKHWGNNQKGIVYKESSSVYPITIGEEASGDVLSKHHSFMSYFDEVQGYTGARYRYNNTIPYNRWGQNVSEVTTSIAYKHSENFGIRLPERLSHELTIGNNGKLNIKYDLYFNGSNLLINNNGEIKTLAHNKSDWYHILKIQKGSTLEIKAGGRLIIENNTKVLIEEGAKLIYHPGARIILNGTNAVLEINQGQLVLQPNAVFQIEAGANGRGYVHVHHDWKPATPGSKIDPPSIVSLGTGCKVHLDGVLNSSPWNYNNDRLLKVSGNVGLVTDDKLEVLRCRFGYLALDKNTQIVSNAKYSEFTNLVVNYLENTSSNLTTKHNGIQINGTRNKFDQIKFSNANYCIRFVSPEGSFGGVLSLSNIEANNTCINGIKQHGGSIDAINCIIKTTKKPADIQATHIPSYVRVSDFSAQNLLQSNGDAFSIHGKGWFYSYKSVYSYSNRAMQVKDCHARFNCNNFQNSTYNMRWTNSPSISLYQGYNLFNSGTKYNHIWGSGNTNIRLNDGHNYFSKVDNPYDPNTNTWGPLKVFELEISNINLLTPTSNPSIPLEFSAKNNYIYYVNNNNINLKMLVPRPESNFNYLAYTYELPDRNISINQTPNLYPNLNATRPHLDEFLILQTTNCAIDPMDKGGNINTKGGGMKVNIWGTNPTEVIRPVNPPLIPIPVNIAPVGTPNSVKNIADVVNNNIRRVINATDSSLDSTINELNYVLTNNQNIPILHQYPNNLELFYAYQLLNEALSIKVALIDSAEADSIKSYDKIMPYVPTTVNTMQTLWNSSNEANSFWKDYKYQIATDWAQVHRLANQRPQAINVLQTSLLSITHPVEDMGITKWICINEAEHAYLTDSVKNWDSILVQFPCLDQEVDDNILQMMIDQYHSGNNTPPPGYQLQKDNSLNEVFDLAMYPNPANNSVTIEIKQDSEMQKIVLYDMKGVMVYNSSDIKTRSSTIDVSNLPDGYYLVQIVSNNKVYQRKLSIVR